MSGQSCRYDEDQVLAYVSGEVAEAEATGLALHLGDCPACLDRAVEFRALRGGLEEQDSRDCLRWSSLESPFGRLYVAATEEGLAWVSWRHGDEDGAVEAMARRFPDRCVVPDPDALAPWTGELDEYFRGQRTVFELDVDLRVLSDFERSVLEAAREIPYGEVIPYAEVARRIRKPRASRAVGNALGHNPVAIVVPCHRVVRSDGTLGGYTGGVEYKRKLLAIEGRLDLLMAG